MGERLTLAPGASASFVGSAVVYTADAKHRVLGVPREILDGPGVVSSPCALAMAQGARRIYAAPTSGSRSPASPGPEAHGGKEPGTVVVALAADDVEHARAYVSRGERDRVRGWAEQAGLDLVRRYLEGSRSRTSSLDI